MYKLVVSLVLSIILAGIQYYIDKDDSDQSQGQVQAGGESEGQGQSKKYPIKPIAIFVSVFVITYMGQTLILNGGISMPNPVKGISSSGGNNSAVQNVVGSMDKVAFEKMMQNVQTGEAPF